MTEKMISDEELRRLAMALGRPDFGLHNAISTQDIIVKLIVRLRSAEKALQKAGKAIDKQLFVLNAGTSKRDYLKAARLQSLGSLVSISIHFEKLK